MIVFQSKRRLSIQMGSHSNRVDHRPILEVIIPTYNRPRLAMRAIQSCLDIDSVDLVVSCNSNGPDRSLEEFSTNKERLRYTSFDENRGYHYNFAYMAKNVRAQFFVILSDEDFLKTRDISECLAYLKSLDSRVAAVSFAAFTDGGRQLYGQQSLLDGKTLDINEYLWCSEPIPNLVTGLAFRADDDFISVVDSAYFPNIRSNSYPHLDLILLLLDKGKLVTWSTLNFVIAGEEAGYGGESHPHIKPDKNEKQITEDYSKKKNLDLNLDIYGPAARMSQLRYRIRFLSTLTSPNIYALVLAKLNVFQWFCRSIIASPQIVTIPAGKTVRGMVQDYIKMNCSIAKEQKAWGWLALFVVRHHKTYGLAVLKAVSFFLAANRRLCYLRKSIRRS